VLTLLNESSLIEGSAITLAFPAREYIEGDSGCNRYGAHLDFAGAGFTLSGGRIDATSTHCESPQGVMRQEQAYKQALRAAVACYLVDGHLAFDDARGRRVLEFAPLERPGIDPVLVGTEWDLVSLEGTPLVAGTEVWLSFADGRMHGNAGCNGYSEAHILGRPPPAADVPLFPRLMVTAEGCLVPGAAEQEQSYLEALRSARAFRLVDDRLEI
jgi:heat shock protein HslJ